LYELVAFASSASRHSSSPEPEDCSRLCARWNLHLGSTIEGRNVNFSSKSQFWKAQSGSIDKVVAVSDQKLVWFDLHHDIKIASRFPGLAGFTFPT
jgi:hypothetical protein